MLVMIGIDPHEATHAALAVDDDQNAIAEFTLESSNSQVERLTPWAAWFESVSGLSSLPRGSGI